jgi:hypothetical protein
VKTPEYKIIARHIASVVCEFTVETDGFSYLVIYGNHVNGGFCAIPNHGIACEMTDPSDIFYNYQSLKHHGISEHDAKSIAAAIREMVP